MSVYLFQDSHFAINENGINFLRHGFTYNSIAFQKINKIEIKKGNTLKNRFLINATGITSVFFSIYYFYKIYSFWLLPAIGRFYIEEFLIPSFLLIMGIYCVYACLKTELTIQIHTSRKHKFSLESIKKKGELVELINYLKQRCQVIHDIH
jgi:hypothetical protein